MGEVFAGRYELLEPIAEGGMGSVWQVHDRQDGQIKAAKILRQSDASSLLRFVREQSMRIDHEHVVTPQSWAGMDDRVLFTMPLVRGGSASSLLKEHAPLPLRWVGALLDQTLQALEAVHAAGIVHRDIKPANLLLEPTGNRMPHLRITDFGIAAPMDEPRMTRASSAIGTPGYMAPEQWHGAEPDPRQDIFAVGVVGLEMLTGVKPPAENRTPLDLDALPRPLPEPTDVARELAAVLERAANPDPQQRPATAAELRAEIAALGLTRLTMADRSAVEVGDHFTRYDLGGTGAGPSVDHEAATRMGGPATPAFGTPSGTPAFGTPAMGTAAMSAQQTRAAGFGTPTPSGPMAASAAGHTASPRGSIAPGLALLLFGLICLILAGALAFG